MNLTDTKKAGIIHKIVKSKVLNFIEEKEDNIKYTELAEFIENNIRTFSKGKGNLNNGIAFPAGLSNNNIAAHDTCISENDTRVYCKNSDVIKIDYGVHIKGSIVDSAFTINKTEKYSPICEASYEAVKNVIKNVRPDVRISTLGEISQEIVDSYEYNNEPVKVIDNLAGHTIGHYSIHNGKYIYGCKNPILLENSSMGGNNTRLEEGEYCAIEIFTTNGNGNTKLEGETTFFKIALSVQFDIYTRYQKDGTAHKDICEIIKNNFHTLPFTQRYINYYTEGISYKIINDTLDTLYTLGLLAKYPPLVDTNTSKDTIVAQYEDTLYIGDTKTTNLTEVTNINFSEYNKFVWI